MITESIKHNGVGTPVPDPESAGMPLTSPMLQTCDKEKVVWECYN